MYKFKQNPGYPNELLRSSDKFYISYNPATCAGNPIALLIGAIVGAENGREETALRDDVAEVWYILNGDFRKEYEEAAPHGFNACLEVYKKNIQHRSEWSTD